MDTGMVPATCNQPQIVERRFPFLSLQHVSDTGKGPWVDKNYTTTTTNQ